MVSARKFNDPGPVGGLLETTLLTLPLYYTGDEDARFPKSACISSSHSGATSRLLGQFVLSNITGCRPNRTPLSRRNAVMVTTVRAVPSGGHRSIWTYLASPLSSFTASHVGAL